MRRRNFLKLGLGGGILAGRMQRSQGQPQARHFYELKTYELRNDQEPARLQEFVREHFVPAAQRHGSGPIGCFSVVAGLSSPSVVLLLSYPSLAALQGLAERMNADEGFQAAWRRFETPGPVPYVRYETRLLKAFAGHPQLEAPAVAEGQAPRLFEFRTYESRNAFSLQDKIDMFNQAEIQIFRECGMAPVFFGEGIAGARLPHLAYLVGFQDMEAREKAWNTFRVHPEWVRIRDRPGWTNAEAVSNIHTSFLRATAFSDIR